MTLFDVAPPRRLQPAQTGVDPRVRGSHAVVGVRGLPLDDESSLVFQARRSRFRTLGSTEGLIQLTTADGFRLDALRLSRDDASAYWIPSSPPSGATIDGRVRRHLESLHAAGYHVLAFDYRGFGRNPGVPSEAGVY